MTQLRLFLSLIARCCLLAHREMRVGSYSFALEVDQAGRTTRVRNHHIYHRLYYY